MKKLIILFFVVIISMASVMSETLTATDVGQENYNTAIESINKKKYVPALKALNKAIEQDANNSLYYFTRAKLRYEAFKDYPGAIADFKKVVELDSNYKGVYSELAYVSLFNKDVKSTKEYLSKAEVQNPEDIKIFLTQALIYIENMNFSKAVEVYDKAIELYPNDSDLYLRRGYAKSYMRRYRSAIKDYDKAIELNPKNYAAYEKRSEAHSTMLRTGKAKQDWIKSEQLRFEGGDAKK